MKIGEVTYSNNNDFKAKFVCEKCGHSYEGWGYADGNFFNNVVPNAICPECGLNRWGENEEQLKDRLGHTYRI